MTDPSFDAFFTRASGGAAPCPYQSRLANTQHALTNAVHIEAGAR